MIKKRPPKTSAKVVPTDPETGMALSVAGRATLASSVASAEAEAVGEGLGVGLGVGLGDGDAIGYGFPEP